MSDNLAKLTADLDRQKSAIRAARQIQKILAKLPDDETRQRVLTALTT